MNGFAPHVRPPSGGAPLPFCERCGNLVGAVSNLIRVGLESCPACGVFACNRCWAGARGACPGCGVRVADASPATARADDRRTTEGARPVAQRRRLIVVFGTLAFALTAGLFVTSYEPRPAGEVETAVGSPALLGAASGPSGPLPSPGQSTVDAGSSEGVAVQPDQPSAGTGSPAPVRGAGATGSPGTTGTGPAAPGLPAVPTARPTGAQPLPPGPATGASPTPGATLGPPAPTALPAPTSPPLPPPPATSPPTPAPTAPPAPTPAPTPLPTPPPTPTPLCLSVPDLLGLSVSEARSAWRTAGFTGSFSPAAGQNNKIVLDQSQAVGSCLSPGASITVTYS